MSLRSLKKRFSDSLAAGDSANDAVDNEASLEREQRRRRTMRAPDMIERTCLHSVHLETEVQIAEQQENEKTEKDKSDKKRVALRPDDLSTAAALTAGREWRHARVKALAWPCLEELFWVFVMEISWDICIVAVAVAVTSFGGPGHIGGKFADWVVGVLWTIWELGGCGNFASFVLAIGLGTARPMSVFPLLPAGVASVVISRMLLAQFNILEVPVPREDWRFFGLPPMWHDHMDYDGVLIVEFCVRALWAVGMYSVVLSLKAYAPPGVRRFAVPAVVVLSIYDGGFRNPTQVLADAFLRRDVPVRLVRFIGVCAGSYVAGLLFRDKKEDAGGDNDSPAIERPVRRGVSEHWSGGAE